MPLDYTSSAELMNDMTFRGRVKTACLKYADYIVAEDPGTPAHSTRTRWSQQTLMSPDVSAAQVTPTVVMQPQVQTDGAAITDANLQTVVEVSVNKML